MNHRERVEGSSGYSVKRREYSCRVPVSRKYGFLSTASDPAVFIFFNVS